MTGRHHISILLALAAAISCSTCALARGSVTARTMLNESGTKYNETVTYYDGLGRPVQTLTKGLNTGNVPVMTATKLNPDGSASRQWLPFGATGITGRVSDANIAALSKASLSDSHAYSDMTYDALGRVIHTSTSGDAWHSASKGISVTHSSNAANSVRKYMADASGSGISTGGYWAACSLRSEKTTDEDGHTVEVFTDFSGRTVLERRGGDHDTYYVYNRAGQLRFVLQPMYEEDPDTGLYAFEYRYDQHGDLVYKAIPGGGYTQYWYDLSHRMTFMQDANLRAKNLYRFFLYDKLGRQAIQGVAGACTPSRTVNSASYTGGSNGFMSTGYTLTNASQIQQASLESVSYYDTYSFVSSLSQDLVKGGTANATGMLTGSVVYASDGSKSMSAIYYDIKGNVIETRELTNFGTTRVTSGTFTFTGQPLKTTMTEGSVTLITENNYDAATGLLTATDVTVNGVKQRVSAVTYDDLGRIASVVRGAEQNSGGKVSYTYNLHGQTKTITGPGFSQDLYYADWTGTKLYNGSVSAMKWTMGSDATVRGYRYTYNGYGWLTTADYGEGTSLTSNKDRYTEKSTAFTRNGGVTNLQRYGLTASGTYGKVDNLDIIYSGNRIKGVADGAPVVTRNGSMDFPGSNTSKGFSYNEFGALIYDAARGITSISYDDFGSPTEISYDDGRYTSNVYSVSGVKLKSEHLTLIQQHNPPVQQSEDVMTAADVPPAGPQIPPGVEKFEYRGPVIYRNSKVDMVLFPGGYATVDGGVTFHYYTQDYLGNNRAVINGSTGAIEQTVAYYPYGGVIADLGTPTTGQPYKFGGKELITANGLNEYDFGARQYYSAISAFTRIDPMAESFPHLSPYLYCANNPVNLVDRDGLSPSEEQAARMADHVYGDENVKLTGGWSVSQRQIYGLTLKDDESGFKSGLYERTMNGVTEYAYVYAGTDFTSLKDWENNYQQIFGQSEQYKIAIKNADLLKGSISEDLTFVGHSLGGGLAAASAYATNVHAMTFNAAGVTSATIDISATANIEAFVTRNDELHSFQSRNDVVPIANGNIQWRSGVSSFTGHSIKNFYLPSMPVQFCSGVKNACISFMNSINNLFKPANILNF